MFKLKVLIVDDQSGIRHLLAEYFRFAGWEVVVAANGKEALARLPEKPDIVLMDVKMPVMDGVDCLKLLRKTHPKLPVIVMTAYKELGVVAEARACGINGELHKPFDLLMLSGIVERAYRDSQLAV